MAVTMTYSASHVLYAVPVTFKGAWMSGDATGYRNGVSTRSGHTYGPIVRAAGSDPWARGAC